MVEQEKLKARVEAVLFAAARPIPLKIIMRACGTRSRKIALGAVEDLRREYEQNSRALELVELPGERYYLKLKKEYMELAKKFLKKPLLSRGVMRTLSFIAYHQPIEQSRVAEARGGSAYKHVKILLEKGLIEAEKSGRTLILKTTPLFAELFGVENNPSAIKRKLREQIKDLELMLKRKQAEG